MCDTNFFKLITVMVLFEEYSQLIYTKYSNSCNIMSDEGTT